MILEKQRKQAFSIFHFSFSVSAGFTLIELLIVVAISALMTGVVITYSGIGRNQVSLSVQETEVAETLARAKTLAVATYGNPSGGSHVCAYGVVFDGSANTYSIVEFAPPGAGPGTCPDTTTLQSDGGAAGSDLYEYSAETWHIPLGPGLAFGSGSAGTPATLVLFYPPDPVTLVSGDSCAPGSNGCSYGFLPNQSGAVYLKTTDGSDSQTITIGSAGQISF